MSACKGAIIWPGAGDGAKTRAPEPEDPPPAAETAAPPFYYPFTAHFLIV